MEDLGEQGAFEQKVILKELLVHEYETKQKKKQQ